MTRLSSLLFAVTFSATAQPNLTGVWELTTPKPLMARIDQQGSAIEITMRAAGDQQTFKLVIGQETKGVMHGAPMTSRAEWDGAALVVHSTATIQGKELRLDDRWALSPDSNTLTFRERHQYGADPAGEEEHAFARRPASAWQNEAPPKPAEEVYKNIQIMKGVPAPRLQGVMTNLTKWLGVDCAHCHVPGQFESDDKPAKQTARKMFQMVRAIGQEYFPGSNPVTCWTCHRGAAKPQSLPAQ